MFEHFKCNSNINCFIWKRNMLNLSHNIRMEIICNIERLILHRCVFTKVVTNHTITLSNLEYTFWTERKNFAQLIMITRPTIEPAIFLKTVCIPVYLLRHFLIH